MPADDFAIRLNNVGKCYRIYANPQDRFRQALRERLGAWLGRQSHAPLFREHWALRDASFEVRPGEAVGILGRNGAGKSTLLQLIAGTLSLTLGTVQTSGRITALLELGSGFNPEFTGRENVFHNAQILGLSREDTLKKFDEIAAFADIGDFIDQPVKTYSSGMVMRLAFSVQTAVEPKILIVDEALSVGDMFFQAKCMARINRLVENGVSLLFVSHDLATIRHLCQKAVLLVDGRVAYHGDVAEATSMYERSYFEVCNQRAEAQKIANEGAAKEGDRIPDVRTSEPIRGAPLSELHLALLSDDTSFRARCDFQRSGNAEARLLNVILIGERGQSDIFEFGERVTLLQVVYFAQDSSDVDLSYKIKTVHGTSVVFGDIRMFGDITKSYRAGDTCVFVWEFELKLGHENYVIESTIAHPPRNGAGWEYMDVVPVSCQLRVLPRKDGMTDGLVSWDAELKIYAIDEGHATSYG